MSTPTRPLIPPSSTFGRHLTRFFTQHLVREKGLSPNTVQSYALAIKLLLQFCCERLQVTSDKLDHERLFLNTRRAPLTRWGISHIVEKYRRLAASACPSLATHHVTPHTFRHTAALHIIQSGVDLSTAQEWLGHAQMQTTHQYTTINIDMKREALAHWPPPQVESSDPPPEPEWLDPDTLRLLDHLSGKRTLCKALPAANGPIAAD